MVPISDGAQVVYERGLILQITLLAHDELRSKGLRFESKGRRLDGDDHDNLTLCHLSTCVNIFL